MAFQTQSPKKTTMSEINVTPLVDVMLVLLIMFMVTTPLMQQGLSVDLPKTSPSGIELKENPFVLIIDARQNIFIDKTKVSLHQLGSKLKAIFEHKKNKQVFIQADKKVAYGFVTEVLAEVRASGVFNVGLVTLPKNEYDRNR